MLYCLDAAEDYIQLVEEEEEIPKEDDEEEVIFPQPLPIKESSTNVDSITKQYFIPPQTGEYQFFTRCSTHCGVTLSNDRVLPEEKIISIHKEDVGQRKG